METEPKYNGIESLRKMYKVLSQESIDLIVRLSEQEASEMVRLIDEATIEVIKLSLDEEEKILVELIRKRGAIVKFFKLKNDKVKH